MHKILSMDIQNIYNKTERFGQLYSEKRISDSAIKPRMSYLKKEVCFLIPQRCIYAFGYAGQISYCLQCC